MLPSKPQSEILVNVFGFIDSPLQCHDYVGHQLKVLKNQPLTSNESCIQKAASHTSVSGTQSEILDFGGGDTLNIGQLFEVEGGVLYSAFVDVQKDGGGGRRERMNVVQT